MIPNSASMATVQGDLDAEVDIAMTIDASATAHIMSVLTNLYSDQELACIREYSTNARDSHIEAGQTRPIEVTLPSQLSPYFKVRDFGVGMNIDDLRDTYSKYGASTKRNSNDFNGTLGLGSKSALTYTHQFLVTSIKDGVKYHIAVSRVDDGTAVMRVIDTVATDEHNGVEISIPVQRNSTFESKAHRFFKFWEPGTVLLNGEDPSVELKKITEGIYTYKAADRYSVKDYIVMANVAYPVNTNLDSDIHSYGRDFGIVAFVETGAVHFTPSREELMYTDATKAVIKDVKDRYRACILSSIRAEINAAANPGDAYKVYRAWAKAVGTQFLAGIKYKGQIIPGGMIKDGSDYAVGTVWNKGAYRYAVTTRMNLAYDRIFDSLVIINYTNAAGVSATNKQKIKEYMRLNNLSFTHVVLLLTDTVPGAPWTTSVEAVDWADIAAIKIFNNPVSSHTKSYAGGYDIWGDDGLKIRHDLKATDSVVYYSDADYRSRSGYELISLSSYQALTSLMPGVRLVQASRNRWDKLRRLFPKAIPLREALTVSLRKAEKNLSWADIARLCTGKYDVGITLPPSKIDDPEIVMWLEAIQGPASKEQKEYLAIRKVVSNVNIGVPETLSFTSPMGKYPLVRDGSKEHSIIYINAVYAARKDK